jgi:hypothetical protein
MVMDDNIKKTKMPKNYVCNLCDYNTCKLYNYNEHLTTSKHKKRLDMIINDNKNQQFPANSEKYEFCHCGKKYKHKSGLARHKKLCNLNETQDNKEKTMTDKELIISLLQENIELKKKVLEVCKNNQPICSINNSNIVNNKTFCLNFFLNEQCKDAMNIMDFVDSLKIQLTDLENVGDLGFVNGISNIFVKNLKALDITKRPVHCSDLKRETLYVKDENKWEKENEEKKKLKKAIQIIANKNIQLLSSWKEKHPDCVYSYSKNSDKYNKLVLESMGGINSDTSADQNKIIKQLSKEITIDKELL